MVALYQAKDFIQTKEGLVFAVIEQGIEAEKVLCFLRYRQIERQWHKLATEQANTLLKEKYPQYLFYSTKKSAHLHGVLVADIVAHHQPQLRLRKLLEKKTPDSVEQDLLTLIQLLLDQGIHLADLGVTGSLLIGAQNISSDIDLVIYDREQFHQLRQMVKRLIARGQLQSLDEPAWQEAYQRRSCDLSYLDYVWHEQRKYNKALINQRKFDLNLIELPRDRSLSYQKQGKVVIQARVVDVQYAFDYPARFLIHHAQACEVVCYTATYTGQAEEGEWIEVSGQLEVANTGLVRILVGSTREAKGEYIKVMSG